MKRSSPASFERKKTITKINNIYHTPFDYHKHVKLIIEWPEFSQRILTQVVKDTGLQMNANSINITVDPSTNKKKDKDMGTKLKAQKQT
jgi:hypothetical protein